MATEERWRAHPWLAALLRLAIVLVPVGVSCLVTLVLLHEWHPSRHRWWWFIALCVLAAGIGIVAERVMRKLTPLATLLRLTMLFPDRAPSRVAVARSAGSGKRLVERVRRGSDDSASEAAEKVLTLITALGNHDRRTRGHSERVRLFTDLLAEELKLPERARDRLRWAALLHDIGKLRIAPAILNKPDKLDDDEFTRMKQHPQAGADLTAPLAAWLGEWSLGIIEHHERFDGGGYPNRLAGMQISRAGRILNVIDSFETMTAARPYKKPMPTRAARAELARCAGGQFDPEYVRAFLSISLPRLFLAMGPLSFLAQLPLMRLMAQVGGRATAVNAQVATAVAGATTVATVGAVTTLAGASAAHVVALAPHHAVPHHAVPHHAPASSARHQAAGNRSSARSRIAPAITDPTATPIPSTAPVSSPPVSNPPAAEPSSAPAESPATEEPPPPGPVTSTPPPSVPTSDSPKPSSSPTPVMTTPSATPSTQPPPPPAITAPGAPLGLSATPGDGQVTVDWSPPADGGSPITGYTVTPYNGATALSPTLVGPDVTSVIVGGLQDGTTYTFDVTATNAVGTSTVASASATPAGPPNPPKHVNATAGDGQATVTWNAPASSGAPVTGYTVTPYKGNVALAPTSVGPAVTTVIIGGLTNGTSYRFVVTATNALGTSPSSTATAKPVGPPAAPTGVSAVPDDGQATVTWSTPADGGSALTGFTVTPYANGTALSPTSVGRNATGATIGGLTNGTTYTFSVTATNAVGTSAAGTSNPVTPAAPPPTATAPSPPGGMTAVAGRGSATVSWAAPASDGGSPVTSYTLTASTAGTVASTVVLAPSATSQVVSGLTDGTAYTFSLIATNAVGSSTPATAGPVTPTGVPDPVSGLTAVAGDSQATVSWTAPSDTGGMPLTGYLVTPVDPGGALAGISVPAGSTSTLVSGLTDGIPYTFDVVAANSLGNSPTVTSDPVIPTPPVTSPTAVQAAPDDSSATVWWSAPTVGMVTSYTVTAFAGGSPVTTTTVSAPQTAAVVSGLTNGTAYTFTVAASTNADTSPASAPSAAVTPVTSQGVGKPPNPTKLTAVAGVGSITVSWTAPKPPNNGPLTSYLVSVYDSSDHPTGQTLLVSPDTTSVTITGLTSGAQYRLNVQATNVGGSSGGAKTPNLTVL